MEKLTMMNRKLVFILIAIASLLSLVACGDPGDKGGGGKEGEVDVAKVLPDVYTNFIQKNITEAKGYSDMLDKVTEKMCAAPPVDGECEHDGKQLKNSECLQLAFYELTEYSTKRLEMFNYLSFQQTIYDVANPAMGDLEKIAWKTFDASTDCGELKKTRDTLKQQVKKLETVWNDEANKNKFLNTSDPEAGVKELLKGISVTIATNRDAFAKPAGRDADAKPQGTADATKTLAPEAKEGAWVVNQAVNRGPQSLYKGNYKKNTWTNTLQSYVKSKDANIDTQIVAEYNELVAAMEDLTSKDDATKRLETKINNNDFTEIDKAIKAMTKLSKLFAEAATK